METELKIGSRERDNVVTRAIREVEGFEGVYVRFQRNISLLGRSSLTFENYVRHLAAMSLHFGRTPLELEQDDVQEYLYELQQRSKTPSQTYFKHTIFGLRFLLKSEGLPYDYLLLPAIRKEQKLPTVLSKQEVWRMLHASKYLKHRMLTGILYGCGLRCMEVCNVRVKDLDFDRKMLHVVQGKGRKDRYVPLSEHLIRGLKVYIKAEHPVEWLFNGQPTQCADGTLDYRYSKRGVQWVVKQMAKQAGILKDVHAHTLRHTYATHLLEDGLDILTVKEMMGHVRIETTMEYLHIARIDPCRAFSPLDTLFEQCASKRK